jgi:hypothetical protein
MFQSIQKVPLILRIFIVLVVLGGIGKLVNSSDHSSSRYESSNIREVSDSEPGNDLGSETRSEPGRAGADSARQQQLQQWLAKQAQLISLMNQCKAEMTRVTQEMQQAAMSGSGMMPAPPACEQNMPYWISQEALAETEIHRLQTGDTHSDVYDVSGIQRPSTSSPASHSSGSSDDGTAAVDNWDRAAIRGTTIYRSEDGTERELPTRDYYYRNRASGEIISSTQAEPPNDGRDYEQLQPVS